VKDKMDINDLRDSVGLVTWNL